MTAEPDTDSRPPPSKLWLLVPPLVLAGTDIVITLLGQRDIYWQGAFSLGDEASPPFAWLIQQHPIWFIAGTHACLAVFCAIILLLPRRGAMLASAAVTLGHAWGASTWLAWHIGPAYSYWTSLAIIILSAVMLVTVWERSCRGAAAPVAGRRTYLAALAAILTADPDAPHRYVFLAALFNRGAFKKISKVSVSFCAFRRFDLMAEGDKLLVQLEHLFSRDRRQVKYRF